MMTRLGTVIACTALVVGCASEVQRRPVEFTAGIAELGQRFTTTAFIELRPDSGYARSIPSGTEFVAIGRIAAGLVLKPTNSVLTLEGKHMHEAYAVRDRDRLVGLYLPAEQAYDALRNPPAMPLQERKDP
jgi:hypothetical protein